MNFQVSCVIDKRYIRIPLKLIKDTTERKTILENIKKQLTFTVKENNQFKFYNNKNVKKIKIYIYNEEHEILFIPKFSKLISINLKIIKDISNVNKEIEVNFKGKLSDCQEQVIKNTEQKLLSEFNMLYSLPCGFGKTVLAIYWICRLKLQTFIVVHKYDLLNQWIQRLKDFSDIKEDEIYTINGQRKQDKSKEYKIYIGMIQTIMRDDFDINEIPTSTGLLISDECHHLGAECFNKGLRKLHSKYYISLSATPLRKDGTENVYKSFIGYNIYKQKREFNDPVKVYITKYFANEEFKKKNEKILSSIYYSKIISVLSENEERNKKILELTNSLILKNKKILILSDRIKQLNFFYENLKDTIKISRSFGTYKENIYDCEILLATYSKASEGLDVKQLDTLILATPKSNIEQSCGRIMREENNKERLIYDILDIDIYEVGIFQRKKQYKKITDSIEEYNL